MWFYSLCFHGNNDTKRRSVGVVYSGLIPEAPYHGLDAFGYICICIVIIKKRIRWHGINDTK